MLKVMMIMTDSGEEDDEEEEDDQSDEVIAEMINMSCLIKNHHLVVF